jgi:hypothetical protein
VSRQLSAPRRRAALTGLSLVVACLAWRDARAQGATTSNTGAGAASADPDTGDAPVRSPEAPLFAPAVPPREPVGAATGSSGVDGASSASSASSDDDGGDQGISVVLGMASGGRVTPGGLRVAGHYLYRLSDRDWFDGAATFVFGSGDAACFRDRQDDVVCRHGLTGGTGVEISARIRHMLSRRGIFQPFLHGGIGLGVAQFSDDELTGFTVPLHVGGGLRANISRSFALLFHDDVTLGLGFYGRGLGAEPLYGFAISLGAEFRLQ